MMTATGGCCLLTPTWSGDLDHFRLLRMSLSGSPLATLPHYVIVQTEDVEAFRAYDTEPVRLLTTADVLPPRIEARRRRACAISARVGRHWTRIGGSLKRSLGLPRWPAYTGWHTQQLCKLWMANELDVDRVIVLDSDVIVTPHATVDHFAAEGRYRCFATWENREALSGKVRNWVDQAERLIGAAPMVDSQVNTYFDTPFILDVPVVRRMLAWLEETHGRPWYDVMLAQPPRRWSEFGTYKAFLAGYYAEDAIDWRPPDVSRYLYQASDMEALMREIAMLLEDPGVHYITLHSQSSGRQRWPMTDFEVQLQSLLEKTEY